jgi:hypothetical protein
MERLVCIKNWNNVGNRIVNLHAEQEIQLLTQSHFWSCDCNGEKTNFSKESSIQITHLLTYKHAHTQIEQETQLRLLLKSSVLKLQITPCTG